MEDKISPVMLLEKVTKVDSMAAAAHGRLDKMEDLVREDLKEIKAELKGVLEWMNKSKGRDAALMFFSSGVGGLIVAAASYLIKHGQ